MAGKLWSLLFMILLWCQNTESYSGKVLLVSMDGFRWDYLTDLWDKLPNFRRFAEQGVKAPYMQAQFVTATFPGHYSIATGLYQETHGIVNNAMYDPVFNSTFNKGTLETRWWEGGEPIWTTAKLQGKKVGTFFWPGSNVLLRGVLPDIYYDYDESVPFEARIETVVDWFVNQKFDFATLYFHEPDNSGHNHGPDSQEVHDMVLEMDVHFGNLLDQLEAANILDAVNIIMTSDHGMTEVTVERLVNIVDLLDMSLIQRVAHTGTSCNILPNPGKEDQVFQALTGKHPNMTVYRKEEIPDKWHYKNNRRVHPIFANMDEGWLCEENHYIPKPGKHGYDNFLPAMRTIFLARGPDFKTGYESAPMNSVDIYGLMCILLKIEPSPNNGTLENILPIINQRADPASSAINVQLSALTVILAMLMKFIPIVH